MEGLVAILRHVLLQLQGGKTKENKVRQCQHVPVSIYLMAHVNPHFYIGFIAKLDSNIFIVHVIVDISGHMT